MTMTILALRHSSSHHVSRCLSPRYRFLLRSPLSLAANKTQHITTPGLPLIPTDTRDWHKCLETNYFVREETSVESLLRAHQELKGLIDGALPDAHNLVSYIRTHITKAPVGEKMIHAFPLSSDEGVALMTLAEALFRIPDTHTRNLLIANKLQESDWNGSDAQNGTSKLIAGLMRLGQFFVENPKKSGSIWETLKKGINPLVAPTARTAAIAAIQKVNSTFIMGENITAALKRANKEGSANTTYSFDMLGEAAATDEEAERFLKDYGDAIHAVGAAYPKGTDPHDKPSVSIKLSALHPRYEVSHTTDVLEKMYERVVKLCSLAKSYNLAVAFDAEESYRLELSLAIYQKLLANKELDNWDGLGFVVQAYHKRALTTVDFIIDHAKKHGRKIPVRLVKGAYWDNEIKWGQTEGVTDYPVFTRKESTDISYLACAQRLLEEALVYPQFATHNPLTVACIRKMAGNKPFEFQRLLGMGKELYDGCHAENPEMKCRIYAPVGEHKELLPYLVRRLLENGANTSFVNHVHDLGKKPEDIVTNPFDIFESRQLRHTRIPLPQDIYGSERLNSTGHSMGSYTFQQDVDLAISKLKLPFTSKGSTEIFNPTNGELIGKLDECKPDKLITTSETARKAFVSWSKTGVHDRAQMLHSVANELDRRRFEFIAILAKESGKTRDDALAEVREAVDFLRYYAKRAEEVMSSPQKLPGITGESNELQWYPRGVFLCISPWNFPLAIFTGQVAATLVTGNCVLSKPASSTPFVAIKMVEIFHNAGIPKDVLQLIYANPKDLNETLLDPMRIDGIAFTGATETAKSITRTLIDKEGPLIPMIAETGGQNAMIVDSSALFEQTVKDVIRSSFKSAGQRCSALRVIYVQDTIADAFIHNLIGAMQELTLGDPCHRDTDVGPVITDKAKKGLEAHVAEMKKIGKLLYQAENPRSGHFIPPTLIEIDGIAQLKEEAFGPILHVVRYKAKDLETVLADITATRYGLTMGLHTRISSRIEWLRNNAHAGNLYVNRDMIGAAVESQPFGGEGYSGTGFKAGGPHYLYRFMVERACTINTTAQGGNVTLLSLDEDLATPKD